ncbi:MAG: ABC transporter substrate-binding protein [Proteobacteria bacterium]|nr:ABC transporter substrate-binding protein [Pseudomonadota bacterium]
MKTIKMFVLVLMFVLGLCATLLAADTLEEVKKKGVLMAGVREFTPGLGSVDEGTGEIVGYDVDFVRAIANKLGVKLHLQPVTSAGRIPYLNRGDIDIIAATMSKTAERAGQIDFSYTYFLTCQKFIVKKGTVKDLADLANKKIGTAKGSTSGQNVNKTLPGAKVLNFDDYPQALLALRQDNVFAITTDETILSNLLNEMPDKERFEIPDIRIANELYGLGIRKGDKRFLDFVNKTLLDMEKSGEAKKIFNKWFGPNSKTPLKRGSFRITAEK